MDDQGSSRTLVWIEQPTQAGWGCSHCAWVFHSAGPPIGETLEEMKRNFQMQLLKEFNAHQCAQHRQQAKVS